MLPDTETQLKIDALRLQLKETTDAREYRSLLGRLAGLSGSRAKKAAAGALGGKAKAANGK